MRKFLLLLIGFTLYFAGMVSLWEHSVPTSNPTPLPHLILGSTFWGFVFGGLFTAMSRPHSDPDRDR